MTFTLFVIGLFSSFVLNHSITVDKDQEGPFYIYNWVRSTLSASWMPKLVRDNHDCPICGSFWSSFVVAVALQFVIPFVSVVHTAGYLFLLTYGMHGVIIFWFRFIKLMYGLGPKEF